MIIDRVYDNPVPGNKAAHSYYGYSKTDKHKRSPRFLCLVCHRNAASRSRAVSCDACQEWIHVNCSSTITNAQYELLVQESEFNSIYDNCTLKWLQVTEENVIEDHDTLVTVNWTKTPKILQYLRALF